MPVQDSEPVTQDLMLAFYRRLYPFKSIYAWLNHEHTPTKLFTHREFAFTLPSDSYVRYQSFADADELKKQVCTMNPSRFEIGPVYSVRPRDKKTVRQAAFKPLLRELVFDIDMTDYDSIRTCCSGADICRKCWSFIAVAVRVLDRGLRDQFGYKHLMWVYSGRRGIHLWVSDNEALELTDDERATVVKWLTIISGGKEMHKKVNVRMGTRQLPPSIAAAYKVLEPVFHDLILVKQNCFASEEGWQALLHLIPDKDIVANLREKWESEPDRSSEDKWQDLEDEIGEKRGKSRNPGLNAAKEDIILQYTYPRLDAEVSKKRNHLLKAPFCIHPKTGRVCVPVDPRTVDKFDPAKVPTVGQLLRELDQLAPQQPGDTAGGEHHSDWERTSLKTYVDMLDKHVMGLMEETRKVKQKAGASLNLLRLERP
ncbi:prim-pol domain-containing protein [Daedaleopsis nitida]|nr:prim-pol domain-containing protein [Daedaleopsis nitida]